MWTDREVSDLVDIVLSDDTMRVDFCLSAKTITNTHHYQKVVEERKKKVSINMCNQKYEIVLFLLKL